MHIPDGYLSPQTYLPLFAVTIPMLAVAARKVQATLRTRHVPLLALGAAFCFTIMMFNIPAPGGTTGHAVGAVLVAILLGPWAACVAVSLAVVIQALLFGDGGITAIGANCFTMAVVMPFAGWYTYRLVAVKAPAASKRRIIAGGIAGYVALNGAALYTAVMLGIQPLIAHGPDGRALYAPYPLSVAVPVMGLEHLLLFGFVEALVTALVIASLQRSDPAFLDVCRDGSVERNGSAARLWYGLAVLALLSPLGVILPAAFGAGSAWGEWSLEEVGRMIGYVPSGMRNLGELWKAPLPDYAVAGSDSGGIMAQGAAYLVSAVIGIGIAALCVKLWGKYLASRQEK